MIDDFWEDGLQALKELTYATVWYGLLGFGIMQ